MAGVPEIWQEHGVMGKISIHRENVPASRLPECLYKSASVAELHLIEDPRFRTGGNSQLFCVIRGSTIDDQNLIGQIEPPRGGIQCLYEVSDISCFVEGRNEDA